MFEDCSCKNDVSKRLNVFVINVDPGSTECKMSEEQWARFSGGIDWRGRE